MMPRQRILNNRTYALALIMLLNTACSREDKQPKQPSHTQTPIMVFCSQCHQAPSPSAHTAAAWPAVIARMQQHRSKRGIKRLSNIEQQAVLDYLLQPAQF